MDLADSESEDQFNGFREPDLRPWGTVQVVRVPFAGEICGPNHKNKSRRKIQKENTVNLLFHIVALQDQICFI